MTFKESLTTQSWITLGLLAACYMLVSFYRTAPSTIAVDIMQDFSVGGGLMAVMSSAFFYPYAMMQVPAGILADRWGARNTICLFLTLGAAGTMLFASASSVATATAGRVLVGLGMAMIFVPALRIILNWFPPHRHALGTGLLLSLGTGGMLVATWPLMMLCQWIGWRDSMFVASILTLVMAVTVWRLVRNKPEDKGLQPCWRASSSAQPAASRNLKDTMWYVVRTKSYWTISLWFFCMYGMFFSFSGLWAGPYFIQGYGMDKAAAGGILFCLALGSTLGPSIVGLLLSWVDIPKTWMLLFSCVTSMVLIAPMLLPVPLISAPLLPLWALAFSVCCAGFGGVALTRIQDDFDPTMIGTATGMINIHTYLGSAILQMVSGWLMERQAAGEDTYTLAQYSHMFWLFMFMACCAFAASLAALKGTKPKHGATAR